MLSDASGHITAEDFQDALDRLQRAITRGTGCYLTERMVTALGISFIGELAAQERPVSDAEK